MSLPDLALDVVGYRSEPRLIRAGDVLWRTVPGAVVLLSPLDHDAVVLCGPGAELWEELAEPRHVEEVALDLAIRYGAPPQVVTHDLLVLAQDLTRRGLLRQCQV